MSFNGMLVNALSVPRGRVRLGRPEAPGAVWITGPGLLGVLTEGLYAELQVSAENAGRYALVSGALPPNMSFDTVSGRISGTPGTSDTQTYNFEISATNYDGIAVVRAFAILVQNVNSTPYWLTAAGLIGTFDEGETVSMTFGAMDADGSVTYDFVSGEPPVGIDIEDGALVGAAPYVTTDTNFSFTLRATDDEGATTDDRTFSIFVRDAGPVGTPRWNNRRFHIGTYSDGTVMVTKRVSAASDAQPVNYMLTAGALPTGLSIASTGEIVGTIAGIMTARVDSTFVVAAVDASSATLTGTFFMTVTDRAPRWITAPDLGTYNEGFVATGSVIRVRVTDDDTVNYTLVAGTLPAGMSLSPTSGQITGTLPFVETSGSYYIFSIQATTSTGVRSTPRTFQLAVRNVLQPPVWVTWEGSVAGVNNLNHAYFGAYDENNFFSYTHVAVDPQDKPVTYRVTTYGDGALPGSLILDAQTGVMTGSLPYVVTGTKRFIWSIAAENSEGAFTSRRFAIDVRNVTPLWSSPTPYTTGMLLGTYAERSVVATPIIFAASDESGITSITPVGGSLPPGLTLNQTGGGTYALTGTFAELVGRTRATYSFTMRAAAANSAQSDRSFRMVVSNENVVPTFSFTGSLGVVSENAINQTFTLPIVDDEPVSSFARISGALPPGFTLNGTTGVITGSAGTYTVPGWTFAIRATDTLGAQVVGTFSLGVNKAPVWPNWSDNLGTYAEGSSFTTTAIASDPESAPLTFSITPLYGTAPTGFAVATGSLGVGTFEASITGTMPQIDGGNVGYYFNLTATDALGANSTQTAFVVNRDLNEAPEWLTPASIGPFNENSAVLFTFAATDPDNTASVTYSLVGGVLPPGLLLSGAGIMSGTTPIVPANTTYNFTLRASDSLLSTDRTFAMTVADSDLPPIWTTPASLGTLTEGANFSYALMASDAVSYGVGQIALPSWATINTSGVLSGTAPLLSTQNSIEQLFFIDAYDVLGQSSERMFNLVVSNRAPVWTTAGGDLGTFTEFTTIAPITLQATDPDGSVITYRLASGTLPGNLSLSNTGTISGSLITTNGSTLNTTFVVEALNAGNTPASRTFWTTVLSDTPAPVWTTPAGLIGTIHVGSAYFIGPVGTPTVTATTTLNDGVTYSVVSGSVPAGMTLTPSGGNAFLTGTPSLPPGDADTFATLAIRATQRDGQFADRIFSLFWNAPPIWTTPTGSVGSVNENTPYAFTFAATDLLSVTIAPWSGQFPANYTFNATTNVMSGTAPIVPSNTTYAFQLRAFDGTLENIRNFSITVLDSNTSPVWTTPAGSLGVFDEGSTVALSVGAMDDSGITGYSLVAGSLPSTLTFNTGNGSISGVLATIAVSGTVTSNFTIRATDTLGQTTDRAFSIGVRDLNTAPVWTTPAGSLGSFNEGTVIALGVIATDDKAVTSYSVVSGALPSGVNLNGTTGSLTGTVPLVAATTAFNFTIRATDADGATTDRAFSLTSVNVNQTPTWTTPSGTLGVFAVGATVEIAVVASDSDGVISSYNIISGSLPSALALGSITGSITGIVATIPSVGTITSNFTIRATDNDGATADRAFAINVIRSPDAWSPGTLTPAVWLDANDATTITTVSSAVSQWNNKGTIGSAMNVTQSTASLRPTLSTLNSLQVINIGSTDTGRNLNVFRANSAWREVFIVAAWDAGGTVFPTFNGLITANDQAGALEGFIATGNAGGNGWLLPTHMNNQFFLNGSTTASNTAFPTIISPFLLRMTPQIGTNRYNGLMLGNDRTNGRSWRGRIAEVVVFETVTTTTNRQLLEGHLAWKWGMQTLLPAGHPYRNSAP